MTIEPFEFVAVGSVGNDTGLEFDSNVLVDPAPIDLFDGADDFVITGAEDDLIDASVGEGGNLALAGTGNDVLVAGTGDVLRGGLGDDTLLANEGNGGNLLFGGDGNDQLFAGGNDGLFGGAGDDTLILEPESGGGNTLGGGSGADTFVIATTAVPSPQSTITDFMVGEDVISIAGLGIEDISGLTFTEDGENTLIAEAAGGNPLALVEGVAAAALAVEANFEFSGAPFDGVPTVSPAPEGLAEPSTAVLVTGDGETVPGMPEDDVLLITDGSGNILNGDAGNDILDSSEGGGNTLNGDAGEDIILAGSGDTANGGADNDNLFDAGGVGGVTFDLTGGGNDNVFLVTSEVLPAAPNSVLGFEDGDLLVLAGAGETADAFEDLVITDDGTDALIADSASAPIATVAGVLTADLTAEDFVFADELSLVSLENPAVAPGINLDVDGDGEIIPAVDILNIFRALAGAPQAIVITEAAAALGVIQQDIVDNVNAIAAIDPLALDVDGSGDVVPAVDVLNIFRSLAGAPQAIVIPEGLDAIQQDVVDATNALVG